MVKWAGDVCGDVDVGCCGGIADVVSDGDDVGDGGGWSGEGGGGEWRLLYTS